MTAYATADDGPCKGQSATTTFNVIAPTGLQYSLYPGTSPTGADGFCQVSVQYLVQMTPTDVDFSKFSLQENGATTTAPSGPYDDPVFHQPFWNHPVGPVETLKLRLNDSACGIIDTAYTDHIPNILVTSVGDFSANINDYYSFEGAPSVLFTTTTVTYHCVPKSGDNTLPIATETKGSKTKYQYPPPE